MPLTMAWIRNALRIRRRCTDRYRPAPEGAAVSRPKIHRDDYELCWVLSGRLRITLPSERYELAAGQSLQFDALLEHTYLALSDCEILILHIRKEKRF